MTPKLGVTRAITSPARQLVCPIPGIHGNGCHTNITLVEGSGDITLPPGEVLPAFSATLKQADRRKERR